MFSAEDFIGAITQHIPDKFFQNIRYYGWYSNKSRGQRKAALQDGPLRQAQDGQGSEGPKDADAIVDVIDVHTHQSKHIPSKHWRELIKKVWEVDPMCCPKCEGEMKVVALIDCPGLIRRILEHLNLWEPINRMIRSRSPPIEEYPEAHLFPGEDAQFALPLACPELAEEGAAEFPEGACPELAEGVDEVPPDDVPTIIYS